LKDLGEPVKTETSEKEIQLTLVNGFADVNGNIYILYYMKYKYIFL